MTDLDFDAQLERQVRRYAEAGVRPVDAFAIAEASIARPVRRTGEWLGRGGPASPALGFAVVLLVIALVGGAILVGTGLILPPPLPTNFVLDPSLPAPDPSVPSPEPNSSITPPSPIPPETATPPPPGVIDRDPGLLAYSKDGDIYLASWDGLDPIRVADGEGAGYGGPSWSPDGQHFAYWADGGRWGEITVADTSGRAVATFDATFMLWSPGSTRLALFRFNRPHPDGYEPTAEILIVELDGTELGRLSLPEGTTIGRRTHIFWSPDGRSIIIDGFVWGGPDPDPPTRVVSLDGGSLRAFPETHPDSNARYFSFSPDGSLLLGEYGTNLIVAAADGLGSAPVVPSALGRGFEPLWSVDGRRIAVTIFDDSGASLFVVNVMSGVATRLHTIPPAGTDQLALYAQDWSPRDDLILASSDSLWVVPTDGSGARLIVSGGSSGDWQPAHW